MTKKACALILLLVFISGALTSCISFSRPPEDPTSIPEDYHVSKPVIEKNIAACEKNNPKEYSFVTEYLLYWGFPEFDVTKAVWAEQVFHTYYNYEGGISDLKADVMPRAATVARLFLDEYYDLIDTADVSAVTNAIIESYVTASGDPYAVYRLPEKYDDFNQDMSGKFGGIGVMVEYNHQDESIMVATVYPDGPADKAGFKVGDFIHAVNGELISDIGYLNAVTKIRGEIGTDVSVTVIRDGEEILLTATRDEVVEQSVSYEITEDNIGYIIVTTFKDNTDEQFAEAIDALLLAEVDGLIFDMRNNTGGYLDTVINMISYLIPTGNTVVTYQYKGNAKATRYTKADRVNEETGEIYDSVVELPMVVLCNEYTASAAEIFTSAIRDYRNVGLLEATTVGTVTYKKGIMQASIPYDTDGSYITLTVAYYNPPCGINYHGIGITPDVEIELDESYDNQLERAVEEMRKLISSRADGE